MLRPLCSLFLRCQPLMKNPVGGTINHARRLPQLLTLAVTEKDNSKIRSLLREWTVGKGHGDMKPQISAMQFSKAFESLNDFEGVNSTYRALCSFAAPDLFYVMSLVQATRKLGQPEKSQEYWNDLGKYGILPSLKLVGAFAAAAAESQNADLARQLFQFLQRNPSLATPLICGQVIKALVPQDISTALEVLNFRYSVFGDSDPQPYITLLSACAQSAEVYVGNEVRDLTRRRGISGPIVSAALIHYAGKTGDLDDAIQEFRRLKTLSPVPDIRVWNAMMGAYAQFGKGRDALTLFSAMKSQQVHPDVYTFTALFTACSHEGLVDEAIQIYRDMTTVYQVKPDDILVTCIVDLLARKGRLDEAETLINRVTRVDPVMMQTLLGACRKFSDVERAERLALKLMELSPKDATAYVLLCNIYGSVGRLKDRARIRKLMEDNGVRKSSGRSTVAVDGKMHTFVAEDNQHPEIEAVYGKLREMEERMQQAGYKPDLSWVTRETTSEEEAKFILGAHSEKLAIAYALLKNPTLSSNIFVTKNLRVCGNCHDATKFLSKCYDRKITVRDQSRFHIFENGACSCNDYW